MTVYGITTDYEYSSTHKRQRLQVWSPPFFSVWEAEGYSLPNGAGFMLTTYNGDKVRVVCPSPRNGDNHETVDQAISDALNAHHAGLGRQTLASHYGSKVDMECQQRAASEAAL